MPAGLGDGPRLCLGTHPVEHERLRILEAQGLEAYTYMNMYIYIYIYIHIYIYI